MIDHTPIGYPIRSRTIRWTAIAALVTGVFAVCACISYDALLIALLVIAGIFAVLGVRSIAPTVSRSFANVDLFSPAVGFPVCFLLWFGVGCLDITGTSDPAPYGLISTGFTCYVVGVFIASRWHHIPSKLISLTTANEWDAVKFGRWMAVAIAVMLASFLSLAARMGIPILAADPAEARLRTAEYGPSQFVFLMSAWTVIAFGVLRVASRDKLTRKYRLGMFGLIAFASLLILSLGSRGNLLAIFLTCLIAVHYLRGRLKLKYLGIAVTTAFVAASIYGWTRDVTLGGSGAELTLVSLFFLVGYVRSTIVTLRDVMQLIPSHVPYQHGMLSFGALLSLLPGHHETSDMFFKRILGHAFVGFGEPATLLGPMYGDFGVAGVVVQMLLLGIVAQLAYFWMRIRTTGFRVLMFAWCMHVMLLSLFGSLFTYVTTLLVPLGWLLFNSLIVQRSKLPEPGPRSSST